MKFCKKCHKMCVSKVTNPNNLYRICRCGDEDIYLDRAVVCRMQSVALASMSGSTGIAIRNYSKKECRKMVGDMQKYIADKKQ